MFLLRTMGTACLIAVAWVSSASAQEAKTREQVKAEFEQALRSGDVIGSGEAGLPLRELHPQTYPTSHLPLIQRSRVIADLAAALAQGDTPAAGEIGLPLNEVNPGYYPPKSVIAGRSREDVKADVREAIRSGELLAGGEIGLPLNQANPRAYSHPDPMRADAHTPAGSARTAMAH